ncbi:hypothetical protein E2R32_09500 [Rathayibacter toxicus]|nr:hypothetical protein E2R32_09500 [Rathayibacter toxicus]
MSGVSGSMTLVLNGPRRCGSATPSMTPQVPADTSLTMFHWPQPCSPGLWRRREPGGSNRSAMLSARFTCCAVPHISRNSSRCTAASAAVFSVSIPPGRGLPASLPTSARSLRGGPLVSDPHSSGVGRSDAAVLGAEAMGVAALSDPQFRLPRRPRLAPGLVIVPSDDGVLVEGGPTRQLLGGSSATTVFGCLFPLLDGSRSIEDLAAASGRTRQATHATVALLYASGLLEDAEGEPDVTGADLAAHAFYSRSIDSTRVNVSGAEAVQRLRASRVLVVAGPTAGGLASMVANELRLTDIGDVEYAESGGVHAVSDRSLLVLVGDSPELRRDAERAAASAVGVYPVRLRGRRLYYGPYLDPSYTVRFDDLAEQIAAESHDDPLANDHPLAAALVVGEITALLSRVGIPLSQQSLVRVGLETLVQDRLVAVPSTVDGIPLAYAFEASTAFPPRALAAPKEHQVHYKQSNVALQRESQRWPSAMSRPLAERADVLHPETSSVHGVTARADRLTAGALSDIVIRTAGNRGSGTPREGKVQRWAASGGNLGSVQLYLLARQIEGLTAGVYGYQRGDDSWAELPWADPHTALSGVDSSADAVLVFTAALGRVASKYGPFAWRIVHLDVGVALTHARLLAAAHGLDAVAAPAWDDDAIAAFLGSDLDAEPVTAVLSLSSATAAQTGAL